MRYTIRYIRAKHLNVGDIFRHKNAWWVSHGGISLKLHDNFKLSSGQIPRKKYAKSIVGLFIET